MVSNKATCDDGSLSSSNFQIAANAFAEKWKNFNSGFPEWLWIDCSNRLLRLAAHGVSDGYLSLQNVFVHRSVKEEHGECSSNDYEETFDDATLVQSNDDDGHWYDFHVVYSSSYCVPVLYFRAHNSGMLNSTVFDLTCGKMSGLRSLGSGCNGSFCSTDGQPLNKDELEKNLPTKSAKVLMESKWTFITQEEHPYLNRPWYTLHPCGTSEWMKLLLASENSTTENRVEQYLISWFSVVGQVFGLKLPLEIAIKRWLTDL